MVVGDEVEEQQLGLRGQGANRRVHPGRGVDGSVHASSLHALAVELIVRVSSEHPCRSLSQWHMEDRA
jgi:hypothetical protein